MNVKRNDIPPKELATIFNKLMDIGGDSVCFPAIEEDADKLVERGKVFNTDGILMNEGAQSQCHRNSALCWEANKDLCDICTGYALSEDGIWRQHSWCLQSHSTRKIKGEIVETTEPRIQYFGFILTKYEAEEFYFDNQ